MYKVFDNGDSDYHSWLDANPDGYVLNRRRGASRNYLVLHRATCYKIRTYTKMAQPDGFTCRGYIKVCSSSIDGLHAYVVDDGERLDGTFSGKCGTCNP